MNGIVEIHKNREPEKREKDAETTLLHSIETLRLQNTTPGEQLRSITDAKNAALELMKNKKGRDFLAGELVKQFTDAEAGLRQMMNDNREKLSRPA